jgi:hypothetical protein
MYQGVTFKFRQRIKIGSLRCAKTKSLSKLLIRVKFDSWANSKVKSVFFETTKINKY